ncbi:helix-turn-helix domain-containing protein [Ralstonia solanacearum]|nr:helix-turn-helix transcriptional regulator [Ralstonia solanacearum]
MQLGKYFDQLRAQRGLTSDNQVGELLGVAGNAVTQYRKGDRKMDNEACLRLAQLLELENPLPVIMAADMDRAERHGQRSLWEVFSTRMAGSATAALLLVVVAGVTNFVTPSAAKAAPLSHSEGRPVYLMLNKMVAADARLAATVHVHKFVPCFRTNLFLPHCRTKSLPAPSFEQRTDWNLKFEVEFRHACLPTSFTQ